MYAFKEAGSLLFFHYGSAVAVGCVCKPQVASGYEKEADVPTQQQETTHAFTQT